MGGILSDDKQNKLLAEYDNWVKLALEQPRPKPLTDEELRPLTMEQRAVAVQARAAEAAKHNENPGVKLVADTRAEIAAKYQIPRNPTTGEFIIEDKIKDAYEQEVRFALTGTNNNPKTKRDLFIGGLDKGIQDQSHFNNAMNELSNFRIFPAIKELFLSIPFVGDVMAAGGKMVMSLFSKEPLGPIAAYEAIKEERALAGGFEQLGIKDKNEVARLTDNARNSRSPRYVEPKLEMGKVYRPEAPEVAAETKKLRDFTGMAAILDAPGTAVVIVNDANGKPVTVIGTKDKDIFTVSMILKTSDDGKTVTRIDAKDEEGKSMEGRQIIIENGMLGAIRKDELIKSTGRVTLDGKAYAAGAPEVVFVAADVNVKAETDKLADKSKASIITLKDGNGQPIVLIGTQDGDKFTVAAVMKKSPDGKSFIKADVKKADGTGSLVGETIALGSGVLLNPEQVISQVNDINKGEVQPGKAYTATSEERDLAALRQKLAKDQPELYKQFMSPGKALMVMQDTKDNNKQVIVIGSMNGNKFTPESILKDINGTLSKVESDASRKDFDLDSKGKLTTQSFAILQASVDIKYRADGKQDIEKLTPDLEKQVRQYAALRFANLEKGEVDEVNQPKVDEFVKRYTAIVVRAGMSEVDQDARAKTIVQRIADAKTQLGVAKVAAIDAESQGATPANPDDAKYTVMNGAIKEAMDILAGKTKRDPAFDDAVKEIEADGSLKPPPTPKATSAGLAKTAGVRK